MTLTVTASEVYGDTPRVQVDITSSPAVSGALKVWRTHEDGTTHRVLAEENAMLVGSWTGLDYHAPFNQDVTYSAEAAGQTSALSAAAMVLSDYVTWLIHPADPELSVPVDKVMTVADYVYEDRSVKFQVLGRRLRVQRTDSPRGGEVGALVIKAETPESRARLKALFADNGPILINTPYTDDDIGWKWASIGSVAIQNPGRYLAYPDRYVSFPYEEITQPDSDTTPLWTYNDLAAAAVADFTTYTALAAAGFASYDTLKLNVR